MDDQMICCTRSARPRSRLSSASVVMLRGTLSTTQRAPMRRPCGSSRGMPA